MDKTTARSALKVLLRSIPLVPGPELFDLFHDLRRSRTSIEQKIATAFESLQSASQLVDDVEIELKSRAEKLSQLRDEVYRYSQLAEIEESKASALLRQLELTVNKGKKRERWIAFAINIVAGTLLFLLGLWLG